MLIEEFQERFTLPVDTARNKFFDSLTNLLDVIKEIPSYRYPGGPSGSGSPIDYYYGPSISPQRTNPTTKKVQEEMDKNVDWDEVIVDATQAGMNATAAAVFIKNGETIQSIASVVLAMNNVKDAISELSPITTSISEGLTDLMINNDTPHWTDKVGQ